MLFNVRLHVSSNGNKILQLLPVNPERRLGMSDVILLSEISGPSFDSPFLYPLLFVFCLVLLLFLSCHFSANGPFS